MPKKEKETKFRYNNGKVKSNEEWSYDLEATFKSQLALQPQYKSMTDIHATSDIPEGAYHIANMAIGLADDDYRVGYPLDPEQSEFGEWVDVPENRQEIYNDAAVWFQE